jgi:recombination protein RecA
MKTAKEVIEEAAKKTESIYIPSGIVTWRLPTGIISLDRILGGGLPGGTIVQIYGPEGAGKTTLAYHIAAESVRNGHETVLIPLEGYSKLYAQACGIDVDSEKFSAVSMDFAEHTFNLTIELVRQSGARVIVMDSIIGTASKSILDKKQPTEDIDKGPSIGISARTIGDFISKVQHPIRRREAILVVVNQLRSEIGRFITKNAPAGGKALQYFTDVKLNLYGKVDRAAGKTETTITIDKGKEWDVTPFATTTVDIYHSKGIDKIKDLLLVCERSGIIKKAGAWYSYNNERWQGIDAACEFVRGNSDLKDKLIEEMVKVVVEVVELQEEEKGSNNGFSD